MPSSALEAAPPLGRSYDAIGGLLVQCPRMKTTQPKCTLQGNPRCSSFAATLIVLRSGLSRRLGYPKECASTCPRFRRTRSVGSHMERITEHRCTVVNDPSNLLGTGMTSLDRDRELASWPEICHSTDGVHGRTDRQMDLNSRGHVAADAASQARLFSAMQIVAN